MHTEPLAQTNAAFGWAQQVQPKTHTLLFDPEGRNTGKGRRLDPAQPRLERERIAYTVKPEVRLTSGRFLDRMAGVAHWVERKGFASSVRLLTEADLDQIEMHNAQLLSGLVDDDAEAVAVARDVACRIHGAVRLNDLTIQTGLVERGYRALLLLLGIGDLRTAHRERIRPHTLVQWKGSRQ